MKTYTPEIIHDLAGDRRYIEMQEDPEGDWKHIDESPWEANIGGATERFNDGREVLIETDTYYRGRPVRVMAKWRGGSVFKWESSEGTLFNNHNVKRIMEIPE